MNNLIAAAKNIGTTHITNGCYRLHPVEWNIGEAAGMLAAYCLDNGTTPRGVRNSPQQLSSFQTRLRNNGFELEWPSIGAV
ncbi:FAD dependent oxidoreductase [compost metagenome]